MHPYSIASQRNNVSTPVLYSNTNTMIYPKTIYTGTVKGEQSHVSAFHIGTYRAQHHHRQSALSNNNSFLQSIQTQRKKNQLLRKNIRRARINNAKEVLRQRSSDACVSIEECLERVEQVSKYKKERSIETLLDQIATQTQQFASVFRGNADNRSLDTLIRKKDVCLPTPVSEVLPATRESLKAVASSSSQNPVIPKLERPGSNNLLATTSSSVQKKPGEKIKVPMEQTLIQEDLLWDGFNEADLGWTADDQELLEAQDEDKSSDDEQIIHKQKTAAEAAQEKQEKESRARKKMEISRHGADARKPKWRLLDSGLSEAELEGRAMGPLEIFRSVGLAVLFTCQLERSYVANKLRTRNDELQDTTNMINLYFDAAKSWVAKTVRLPLISVINEPSLSFEKAFTNQNSGLLSKIMKIKRVQNDETVMTKLRVRVKGILSALIKATSKNGLPQALSNFLKKITSDGVYFPKGFLFDEEKAVLDFNRFGATQNMLESGQDDMLPSSERHARGRMLIANFLLTRILIHVILQPWKSNIGSRPKSKNTINNLKILASIIFQIVGREFPLFEPGVHLPMMQATENLEQHVEKSVDSRTHLRKKSGSNTVDGKQNNSKESENLNSSTTGPPQESVETERSNLDEYSYYESSKISCELLPRDFFQIGPEFEGFISEQQHRLQEWMVELVSGVHPEDKKIVEDIRLSSRDTNLATEDPQEQL